VEVDWSPNRTLGHCEGDCDSDSECESGMDCYHDDVPPGCKGTPSSTTYDYCYDPFWASNDTASPSEEPTPSPTRPPTTGSPTKMTDVEIVEVDWSPNRTLAHCEGDCDDDSDCEDGLDCYHDDVPPGCKGTPSSTSYDYCYDPLWASNETAAPTSWPTTLPTVPPTTALSVANKTLLVFRDWDPYSSNLGECVGDCDSDDDCRGSLVCFHNYADDLPPGCYGAVTWGADYCYDDGSTPEPTWPTAYPTAQPTSEPTADLDLQTEEAQQCQTNYNLGTFANSVLCAAEALSKPRRCDVSDAIRIMWDDNYSVNEASWGCRCCKSGAVFTNHSIWSLMTYAKPTTTPAPTAEPTADLDLQSEQGMQCQSNYNLGTFTNAELCAEEALSRPRRCDVSDAIRIMWDDAYSVNTASWGCRCCQSGAVFSNHSIWELRTYAVPTVQPTSDPTVDGTGKWPTPQPIPVFATIGPETTMGNITVSLSFAEWLSEGMQFIKIPDTLPTSFVITVGMLVFAVVAFFRCYYWKKQKKSYKMVGFGGGNVSDSETDIEVVEPMNA